jgi:hypothetical protein
VFNDPDRFHLELDLAGLLRGDYQSQMQVGINAVRAGVLTPNELRQQMGFDRRPDGDKLVMQASGGRPPGTDDGEGATPPDPGAPGRANGTGRVNGAGYA